MFLQITFQIVQGGELVTLRRADVFVAGHVLHLAQVVCLQPVRNDAAAELRRINDPWVKPAKLLHHPLHPIIDIGGAGRLLSTFQSLTFQSYYTYSQFFHSESPSVLHKP